MALADSALSLAAEHLVAQLNAAFPEVRTVADNPHATAKMPDGANPMPLLNLFFYRIAPSPTHVSQTSEEPIFLRLFALLTPFPVKDAASENAHLKILGEVIRHFHENPVSAVLGTPLADGTKYRLRAILQAPSMEELNHIWTTQGSDVPYQMSAAYEFSLVPIDPAVLAPPAGQVLTTLLEVRNNTEKKPTPQDFDLEITAFPGFDADAPRPAPYAGSPHLPIVLARTADGPAGTMDVAANAPSLALALAGAPGRHAQLRVAALDANGAELLADVSNHPLATHLIDHPDAHIDRPFAVPPGTEKLVVAVRASDAQGARLQPERVGNTLTLSVAP